MPNTPDAAAPSTHLDSLTRAKQVAFLTAYTECGNISRAAFAAEVDRSSHYWWMKNDPDYPAAFDEAEAIACDNIRHHVRERATDGWDEPIVYQGVISKDDEGKPITVRKRSDRLLELLAKAKCPEFRDKQEVTTNHTHTVYDLERLSHLTDEELARLDDLTRKFAVARDDRSRTPST